MIVAGSARILAHENFSILHTAMRFNFTSGIDTLPKPYIDGRC